MIPTLQLGGIGRAVAQALVGGGGGDPYVANDVVLFHMDGPETFAFPEQTGKLVTAVGDAQVSTAQSVFGGASAVFDGTGDVLTVPDSADFDFGTSDFTVEFWMRPTTIAGTCVVITKVATAAVAPFMVYRSGTSLLFYSSSVGSSSWDIANGKSLGTVAADTWYYVAVTRLGTQFYTFLNGVQQDTWSSSATVQLNTAPLSIGACADATAPYAGWVDEVRITKGVGRYTAGFSTPVAPFPDSVGGDSDFASVTLLLHLNVPPVPVFTGCKTADVHGNMQIQSAQSVFGGKSAFFDGASWLTIPDDVDLDFGSGDFAIEFWMRPSSIAVTSTPIQKGISGLYAPFAIYCAATTGALAFYASSSGTSADIANGESCGTVAINTWYHVAVTRSGNTFRSFLNGVQQATWTSALSLMVNTTAVGIGGTADGANPLNGWIDELRITKGVARYTAGFTPPVTPFTDRVSTTATGGVVTFSGTHTLHTFGATDVFHVNGSSSLLVDYLLVGGGGGPGNGGGGGGAVYEVTGETLTAGDHTVTVGIGGANSTAGGVTSFATSGIDGGGFGGSYPSTAPSAGGNGQSGGGGGGIPSFVGDMSGATGGGANNHGGKGTNTGTANNAAGGGGGADATSAGTGGDCTSSGTIGGIGGAGKSSSITGSPIYYGGGGSGYGNLGTGAPGAGGGGQGATNTDPGKNGKDGKGGGAGGGTTKGGDGVVIVRYLT